MDIFQSDSAWQLYRVQKCKFQAFYVPILYSSYLIMSLEFVFEFWILNLHLKFVTSLQTWSYFIVSLILWRIVSNETIIYSGWILAVSKTITLEFCCFIKSVSFSLILLLKLRSVTTHTTWVSQRWLKWLSIISCAGKNETKTSQEIK